MTMSFAVARASIHGPKRNRKIERGKSALADDHRMDEFDGDVLRVGCIRAAAEGKQPAAAKKAVGHFTGSFGQPARFTREERCEQTRCAPAGAVQCAVGSSVRIE